MSPTPRLVALLTLAAALTAVIGAAVGLPLALLAVVLGAVDARGVREAPVVTWQVPTVLARGRPATLSVSLTGGHGRRIVIRQPLPASLRAVPDRGVGSLESRLTGLRRGPVVLDGPVVRLEGRMGLARWTHSVPDKRSVKVLADMPGVRRLALEVRRGMRPAGARSGRRLVGLGTDFEAIREYQPDDDIRQVNWSASARAGRPMSNTYRVDQEREVVCLLDCGRLMAAPVGDRTRLDAAVDAVCAVALVADQASDRCGLTVFDDAIRAQLAPRRSVANDVVEVASAAEVHFVDSRYELAFQSVLRRKRALVMVFTDILDRHAARSLVAALPVLARRHAVVVLSSRDEEVERLADAPGDVEGAYTTAVALSVLSEVRDLAALLSRAGAKVVSAAPEALPVAAVDSYLRLKARARL